MKKKGLIISTIVMVVVLIASLTTATYAWFSSQADAAVDQITLTTSAADGLLIGVHGTNSSTSSSVFQDYKNGGALTFATTSNAEYYAGSWSAEDGTGFGAQVGFAEISSLNAQYGVQYTTQALTDGAEQNPQTVVAADNWFKASGNGPSRSTIDPATISYATANTDFIVLDLGCTPSKADLVKQAWVTIKVTLTGGATASAPGMAAAVNFAYAVNNASALGKTSLSSLTQVDAFSGMTQSNGYNQNQLDAGAIATENAVTTWSYSIQLFNSETYMVKNTDIGRIYLVIFLDGDDDACILANLGTGCTIDISFGWSGTYNAKTFTNGVIADTTP